MVSVQSALQEHYGHECSDYNDGASQHLVHACRHHGQGYVYQSRSNRVENGWNQQKQRVNRSFQLFARVWGISIWRSWGCYWRGMVLVVVAFDAVKEQTHDLVAEHYGTLHEGVVEVLVRPVALLMGARGLILELCQRCIHGAGYKHAYHN